jgi:hypothetical protein
MRPLATGEGKGLFPTMFVADKQALGAVTRLD